MLHFAYKETETIHAQSAQRGVNYTCPECGRIVRLKKGLYRKPHFYHLSTRGCRHAQKGPDHLAIQEYLKTLIPHLQLEAPFPTLGRIADCYWPNQQIVFEVQCARLSFDEIEARSKDYRMARISPVWIFHTKSFKPSNQRLIDALNRARIQFYFTNIRRFRTGIIFDFYDRPDGMCIYPISVGCPRKLNDQHRRAIVPAAISKRIGHTHYFLGDILDRYVKKNLHIPFTDSLYRSIDKLLYRMIKWVHGEQ